MSLSRKLLTLLTVVFGSLPAVATKAADDANFAIGQWTGHAEIGAGRINACMAGRSNNGNTAALVVVMDSDGSASLVIGDERWPLHAGNTAVVRLRIDKLDLGAQSGIVAVQHTVTLPLANGQLMSAFQRGTTLTADLGGISFSIQVENGSQVLERLRTCLTETTTAATAHTSPEGSSTPSNAATDAARAQ
jgi:hypothetical protein